MSALSIAKALLWILIGVYAAHTVRSIVLSLSIIAESVKKLAEEGPHGNK